MNKRNLFIEIIGWYGVVALVVAYTLATFGYMSAEGFWFQFLNMTGSVGIVIVSLYQNDWQPAVLNIIWALIGLVALVKMFI